MNLIGLRLASAALFATALAPQVHAHAVLDQKEAPANTYHRAIIRIPHGCAGSATIAVAVTLPPSILRAKPQPKPGWTITIATEPLPKPVSGPHGAIITERVREIRWDGGPLPDEHFDDFAITFRLPDTPGEALYFPTRQVCEKGEHNWSQIDPPDPAKGEPAPKLFITPAPRAQAG